MSIEFLGDVQEQIIFADAPHANFLAKLALSNCREDATLLNSLFTTTWPAEPDTLLTIHGAHMTVDEHGVDTHSTKHHVAIVHGSDAPYVLRTDEMPEETIQIRDPEDMLAITALIAGNGFIRGSSAALPPVIPHQKRPD